jgi:hypothetical protein
MRGALRRCSLPFHLPAINKHSTMIAVEESYRTDRASPMPCSINVGHYSKSLIAAFMKFTHHRKQTNRAADVRHRMPRHDDTSILFSRRIVPLH